MSPETETKFATAIAMTKIRLGEQIAQEGHELLSALVGRGQRITQDEMQHLEQRLKAGWSKAELFSSDLEASCELDSKEIDPGWFKPNNKARHLTDAGKAFILNCFRKGMEPYDAAKRMGIAYTAARMRYDDYCRENGLPLKPYTPRAKKMKPQAA